VSRLSALVVVLNVERVAAGAVVDIEASLVSSIFLAHYRVQSKLLAEGKDSLALWLLAGVGSSEDGALRRIRGKLSQLLLSARGVGGSLLMEEFRGQLLAKQSSSLPHLGIDFSEASRQRICS